MALVRDSTEEDPPMTAKTPSPADDLAFMRNLVEGGGGGPAFGEGYLAAGLIYGVQVILQGLQAGLAPAMAQPWPLVIGIGPTLVFCAVLGWILWRHRAAANGSYASRMIGALFGCIGLANFALMAVIGIEALRRHSLEIWLIYPCVVFVMQGACWLAASAIRRRGWYALVAFGWFASAVAMALNMTNLAAFTVAAGVGLLAFMAAPGAVLMRLAQAQR